MREIEQKKKQGINIFKRFWNPSIFSPFLDILGCLVPKSLRLCLVLRKFEGKCKGKKIQRKNRRKKK